MKIKDSKPFKDFLADGERRFGKCKMGWSDTIRPLSTETVEKLAQEIYNSLIGLTYYDTVLIREIVWEQLRIERDCKALWKEIKPMSKHKHFHSPGGRGKAVKAYAAYHRRYPYGSVPPDFPLKLKKTAPSAANAESGDKVEIEPVSTSDDTSG
ncbi:MAG: hypothetical protein K2O18_08180 [Oscillospiraceae bacterium]|nr:hypothetical protein [Oscillospiraceae bacterium]